MLSSENSSSVQAAALPNCDLHNHTIYSGHSDDDATIENMIARANELCLGVLGLSEHLMRAADLGIYDEFQRQARSQQGPGAQILVGVEMDIDPADASARWVVPEVNADYVILSAHGFPEFDLELPESTLRLPFPMAQRKLAMRWLQWYGLAVARGGMQILGHPLREPINMGLIDLADGEMMDASLAVFRPAAEQGIAFELNNSFLERLDALGQLEDYVELIQRLRSMGMRFARGSDAHSVATVGACGMIAQAAHAAGLGAGDWLDTQTLPRRQP